MKSVSAAIALTLVTGVAAARIRTFTVHNNCPFTIWLVFRVIFVLPECSWTYVDIGPPYAFWAMVSQ